MHWCATALFSASTASAAPFTSSASTISYASYTIHQRQHQFSVFAAFIHSMPLSIHFLFLAGSLASFLRRLFGFLIARLPCQLPPLLLASSASRTSVPSVYPTVPIFTGYIYQNCNNTPVLLMIAGIHWSRFI